MFKKRVLLIAFIFCNQLGISQLSWVNVDSLFQPLPNAVRVYKSDQLLEGKPNIAYYVVADLKDKNLVFINDTSDNRRLTPLEFYQRNDQPLITVNCTFFSFETNKNLSLLVSNGKILSHNGHIAPLRGKDTLTYAKYLGSAIGISKRRKADVSWIYSDSTVRWPYAYEFGPKVIKDSSTLVSNSLFNGNVPSASQKEVKYKNSKRKWKMKIAVGGGPVLLHDGKVRITNNEERKFMGNGINDKHPRTAMGYTKDNKLIILVIQGRSPGIAEGATLLQEAQILKALGCVEAINLDGGGSSCLLINGKETITPSDKGKQRAIPAVFMIKQK